MIYYKLSCFILVAYIVLNQNKVKSEHLLKVTRSVYGILNGKYSYFDKKLDNNSLQIVDKITSLVDSVRSSKTFVKPPLLE